MTSACCSTHNASIIPNHDSSSSYTPFAPRTIQKSNRISSSIFDPHCHIFNGTDIQAGGYLKGPVANEVSSSLVAGILRGLSRVADQTTRLFARSAAEEYRDLVENRKNGKPQWITTSTKNDTLLPSNTEDKAEAFARIVHKRRWLQRDLDEYVRSSGDKKALGTSRFDSKYLLKILALEGSDEYEKSVGRNSNDPTIVGAIKFIFFLMNDRSENLLDYQRGYTSSENSLGIDRCFASMVDFDYWIGRCNHPESRTNDQMLLMSEISKQSNGYMKPIVSYNPWTDIAEDGASLDLVKRAIENHGFVGVKIYPQMGFFPSGNSENKFYPRNGRYPKDLVELDTRLSLLFEYCSENSIPVMAHSEESRGQTKKHNQLGGPGAWERFFTEKNRGGIRINLAHVGGSHERQLENGWNRKFANIMSMNGASGLFGDLGFWNGVASGDPKSIEGLIEFLNTRISDSEMVLDRIMFGTDWYMLTTTGRWKNYARKFHDALGEHLDQESMNKLFYKNCQKFYSL